MNILYENGKTLSFKSRKEAINHVDGFKAKDGKLFDKRDAVLGFDNEHVAYFAGEFVTGKDKRNAKEEIELVIDRGLSLYEFQYEKGEIKDKDLRPEEIARLKLKLGK